VVAAITNHTEILTKCLQKEEEGMSVVLCSNALKYLVHFFGDITQPLHCSGKSLGGNQIFVQFDGLTKKLHEVLPLPENYFPLSLPSVIAPSIRITCSFEHGN